jgi:hypothetical protein
VGFGVGFGVDRGGLALWRDRRPGDDGARLRVGIVGVEDIWIVRPHFFVIKIEEEFDEVKICKRREGGENVVVRLL